MSVGKYPSEKCSNLGKYTIKMATPFHIESDVIARGIFMGERIKWGVSKAHIFPSITDKNQLLQ